ncbi:MAG: hypothetical protein MUO67_19765, partial [Anaerolineales bacterium]|nr:hypothetical protein [Anaerolineales bacterium]
QTEIVCFFYLAFSFMEFPLSEPRFLLSNITMKNAAVLSPGFLFHCMPAFTSINISCVVNIFHDDTFTNSD